MLRLLIISLFILNTSCQSNPEKPQVISEDSLKPINLKQFVPVTEETLKVAKAIPFIWLVDFENHTKTKNPNYKREYLNVDSLIQGLNEINTGIKLDKIKISGDTLFTEIKDNEYLGERIGSYGALSYIADVVINLTSVKNINYIKIEMEDGSHISQGTWSKKEYDNYKIIKK